MCEFSDDEINDGNDAMVGAPTVWAYRDREGWSPTVHASWFIAKAYEANMFFLLLEKIQQKF